MLDKYLLMIGLAVIIFRKEFLGILRGFDNKEEVT